MYIVMSLSSSQGVNRLQYKHPCMVDTNAMRLCIYLLYAIDINETTRQTFSYSRPTNLSSLDTPPVATASFGSYKYKQSETTCQYNTIKLSINV